MVWVRNDTMVVVRVIDDVSKHHLSTEDIETLVKEKLEGEKDHVPEGIDIETKTSFNQLNAREQWQLCKFVASLPNLKILKVSSSFVPLEALSEMLRLSTKLETFTILGRSSREKQQMGDGFSKFAFAQFCGVLQEHPSLQTVDFQPTVGRYDPWEEEFYFHGDYRPPSKAKHNFDLAAIVTAFSKMASLRSLSLRPKIISEPNPQDREEFDVSLFFKLLESKSLEKLSLDLRDYWDGLVHGDSEVTKFARALKQVTNLKTLCYFDDDSHTGLAIARALKAGSSLTSVTICQTDLPAPLATSISQLISVALTTNRNLIELRLPETLSEIKEGCKVDKLMNAIKTSKTLNVLDLSSNALRKDDLRKIASAFHVNSSLETVDLRDNYNSYSKEYKSYRSIFRDALKGNMSIVSLETGHTEGEWNEDTSVTSVEIAENEWYCPARDSVVDFYVRLNRAGRHKLLKGNECMSHEKWVEALVAVNEGGCNGKEDKDGYDYDADDYFIEHKGWSWQDCEKFALDRDDLSCLYYFIRQDPAKFFFGGRGAKEGTKDLSSNRPAKKIKIS